MTAPLNVAPPELRSFADRLDGCAETAGGLVPATAFDGVASAVTEGRVAEIASALGPRLDRSATILREDLGGMATNTRTATDVIAATDSKNAATIGER